VLAAQVGGLHASLMLAQHANDLIRGKSASPHHSSPSDELTYQWHDFWGARQATSTIRRNLQIQETEGLFQLPPRAVANEMLLHVIEPFAAQTFYQPTYGPALSFAGQFKRTLDRARPFRESHLASDNGPSCCVRFFSRR
jgi:hypothetical protein